VNGVPLRVEIASTADELARGLMHRKHLAENEGMLFDMGWTRRVSFWMKDTLIPLSAAFVLADGTITEIIDMEPLNTTQRTSSQPVRYVIEVNRGWFLKNGIKPGDMVRFPPEE